MYSNNWRKIWVRNNKGFGRSIIFADIKEVKKYYNKDYKIVRIFYCKLSKNKF